MAVGQGAEAEAAQEHAEQPGTEGRGQLRAFDVPAVDQLRGDVANGGRVETVQQDDQETQQQHAYLQGAQWAAVDEFTQVLRSLVHGWLLIGFVRGGHGVPAG